MLPKEKKYYKIFLIHDGRKYTDLIQTIRNCDFSYLRHFLNNYYIVMDCNIL